MRTTLTIDDDVDAMIRQFAADRGLPFKEAVNMALRLGLLQLEKPPQSKRYRTKVRSLGTIAGIDYDKVGQLSDEFEDLARLRRSESSKRR